MNRELSSAVRSMPWPAIVERYRTGGDDQRTQDFAFALEAILSLANAIAGGPLSSILFGWTSMLDLCIQQTDALPGTGPYLKISPFVSGDVEFRYIDTTIAERQWNRVVPPEAVMPRLQAFIDQLHWIG